MELNTYGDLKKVIKAISLRQKGEKLGNIALGTLIGFIPGAEAAKTTFEFIRAAMSKPDTRKTKTWLDKLDIDDEMSAIVDDTVENGFMQTMSNTIESKPDNQPLESDFNMNAEMVEYLRGKYEGRTVAGIQENKINKMNKTQLKQIIREMLLQEVEVAPQQNDKIQGQIKIELFKKLGVVDFDPTKFSATINLVKQNKNLNPAANKVLADVMIAMLKTSDDNLLNQIFSNLKSIEAK